MMKGVSSIFQLLSILELSGCEVETMFLSGGFFQFCSNIIVFLSTLHVHTRTQAHTR